MIIPDGDVPAGGWPAIVFNHGYIPPDVYRTTERYVAYLDRLASSGTRQLLDDRMFPLNIEGLDRAIRALKA